MVPDRWAIDRRTTAYAVQHNRSGDSQVSLQRRLGDLILSPEELGDSIHEDSCPVPLTVRGTQALVSFAPLAFKLFCAARQNAVLRRSPFRPV